MSRLRTYPKVVLALKVVWLPARYGDVALCWFATQRLLGSRNSLNPPNKRCSQTDRGQMVA